MSRHKEERGIGREGPEWWEWFGKGMVAMARDAALSEKLAAETAAEWPAEWSGMEALMAAWSRQAAVQAKRVADHAKWAKEAARLEDAMWECLMRGDLAKGREWWRLRGDDAKEAIAEWTEWAAELTEWTLELNGRAEIGDKLAEELPGEAASWVQWVVIWAKYTVFMVGWAADLAKKRAQLLKLL